MQYQLFQSEYFTNIFISIHKLRYTEWILSLVTITFNEICQYLDILGK